MPTDPKPALMNVTFSYNDRSISVPKSIGIHIHDRVDLLTMLVGSGKAHGVQNTDYKDRYDLIVNPTVGSITRKQCLVLLKSKLIEKICWLDHITGEYKPIRTLRIRGEHETIVVVGLLGEGFFMKPVDPDYILDCMSYELE